MGSEKPGSDPAKAKQEGGTIPAVQEQGPGVLSVQQGVWCMDGVHAGLQGLIRAGYFKLYDTLWPSGVLNKERVLGLWANRYRCCGREWLMINGREDLQIPDQSEWQPHNAPGAVLGATLCAQNLRRDITEWMVQAAGPTRSFAEGQSGKSSMAAAVSVCAVWAFGKKQIPVQAEIEFYGQGLVSTFKSLYVSLPSEGSF